MATFVLIHGAYQGGWIWQPVASRLRAAGHTVYTPTLDGCAERRQSLRAGITTETHAQEIADLLYFEDLKDVVLAGTSSGGMVMARAAEQARDRVARVVFADALALMNGEKIIDIVKQPAAVTTDIARGPTKADATGRLFKDLEPGLRDWAAERITLHPIGCFANPVKLDSFWQQSWKASPPLSRKHRANVAAIRTPYCRSGCRFAAVQPLKLRDGLALAFVALLTCVLIVALAAGLRADLLAGQLDPVFLLSTGLFLLLAGASTVAVIEMSRPYVGGNRDGWMCVAATAALLPASAALIAGIAWFRGAPLSVDSEGINCLAVAVMLGLLVGLALVFWLKKGAATSPERAGLLTGLAAGSSGIFAFALHCPHNDIAHIGLWHGLAVAVSAAIGRLVIPAAIRW